MRPDAPGRETWPCGVPAGKRTVDCMSHLLYSLLAGLLAAVPLARFAARRSVRQPVAFNLDAEHCVLASVALDPYEYIRLTELRAEMFAAPAHRTAWSRITEALGMLPVLNPETAMPLVETRIRSERDDASIDDASVDAVRVAVRDALQGAEPETLRAADANELLEAGAHILADFEDRTLLNGVSEIIESGTDPTHPLIRRYRRPGLLRVISSGALFATMLAAGVRLVELSTVTASGALLGYLTVAVLAAGSLIWALVDWDTFYLDTPSFWPFTIAAWLGAIGTGVIEGDVSRPLAGLAICAGGAIVFVGANLVYLLVRGVNGMGFGDTLILFATAGVPAALTGSWQLGYMAIIGSMLLGIVGWLLLRIAGRVTRESRFAFGPYLAIGWAIAAAVWSM